MANKIEKFMTEHGVKFIKECVPEYAEIQGEKIKVGWNGKSADSDLFDTVLIATGRTPDTNGLGVKELHMKLDNSGKIIVNENDETNIPSVYALGDCVSGRMELTPPAIKAGEFLAKRLFEGSDKKVDYKNIATAVFTPLEYGTIGLSEENAIEQFGEQNIEVYHTHFTPLEWNYNPNVVGDYCYAKILVKKDDQLVVGFHYLGPNAGEVT